MLLKSTLMHLVHGNLAADRMNEYGVRPGDTVIINTKTAPSPSRFCAMKTTIKEVLSNGYFRTQHGDAYFGYTLFHITDIIG